MKRKRYVVFFNQFLHTSALYAPRRTSRMLKRRRNNCPVQRPQNVRTKGEERRDKARHGEGKGVGKGVRGGRVGAGEGEPKRQENR